MEAAVSRIIPNDENGPGALEAGAAYFIDKQLALDPYFYVKYYAAGPFKDGQATQGDQSTLPMAQRYHLGLAGMDDFARRKYSRGFPELSSDQQDQVLLDMESGQADTVINAVEIQNVEVTFAGGGTEAIQEPSPSGKTYGMQAFFHILRGHTIVGFFADPIHGGNRDMMGWKLIGFPGAQIGGYRGWILNYGVPFTGPMLSLADYQRRGGMQSMPTQVPTPPISHPGSGS